jgi:hypothetical protein
LPLPAFRVWPTPPPVIEHDGIIITSIISGNRYLFSAPDIEYINDVDFRRYQKNAGFTSNADHRPLTALP